jgi:hypothetical protein
VGFKPLAVGVGLLGLISPVFSADSVVIIDPSEQTDTASNFWPWEKEKPKLSEPPKFKPYSLPTLHNDERSYQNKPAPLIKAPEIPAESLFNSIMNCYPATSNWKIEIALKGSISSNNVLSVDDNDTGSTSIGQNYVRLVASMPIYSSKELSREREREYRRRTDTAGVIADFIKAIASRNHAIRELALYRSLEDRARLRVQKGIADAGEQVKYLEKVSNSQLALITTETKILDSRLRLMSMCTPDKADRMNIYLTNISNVPL